MGAKTYLWIFLAGGTGAVLRVILVNAVDRRWHDQLPYVGTLTVNMLGCAAIGAATTLIGPTPLRPIILAGLLGGFTTYSAFGLLSWELLREGRTAALAGQLLVHLGGGIICVWIGLSIARWLVPEGRL